MSLEIVLYYYISEGISTFPENLIIPLLVFTVCLAALDRFMSDPVAVLTYLVSTIGTVFMVDWFFSSSPNPSILSKFFTVPTGISSVIMDMAVIGLVGGLGWFLLVELVHDGASSLFKERKMSMSALRARSANIVVFFDHHPWIATFVIGVITLAVGYLIGTRR